MATDMIRRLSDASLALSEKGGVFRASSLNLMAVATDRRMVKTVEKTITAISQRHPSRAIIIFYQPAAAVSDMERHFSSFCRITETGQEQICCEQILLHVKGHLSEHIPSALASLLTADLPVYLWWASTLPPGDSLLERLIDQSDHLITSTGKVSNPGRSLVWLAKLEKEIGRSVPLMDTSWASISEWRTLVVLYFDSHLIDFPPESIDSITIRHGTKRPSAEAFLLGGWLSSSLEWRPQSSSTVRGALILKMSNKGLPAKMKYVFDPGLQARKRNISSIRIRMKGKPSRTLSMTKESLRSCLTGAKRFTRRDTMGMTSDFFGTVPLEEILCRFLEGTSVDTAYIRSLKQAAAMLALEKGDRDPK